MCGPGGKHSNVEDAFEASRLCFSRRRLSSSDVSPESLESGTTIRIAAWEEGEEGEAVKQTGEETLLCGDVDDVTAGVDLKMRLDIA